MNNDANEVIYTRFKLFGKDVLLADERIDRSTLPEGIYCYDIRHDDQSMISPATIEEHVVANWYGTILSKEPIALDSNKDNQSDPYRMVKAGNFSDKHPGVTLDEWLNDGLMTILVVEPMKKPYVKEIKSSLENMQSLVGGYIQAVYPFDDNVAVVCNEEGKLLGLQPNRFLKDENGSPYDMLCGTFFVAGLNQLDNFASLSDEQVKRYTQMYSEEMILTVPRQAKSAKPKQPER